MRRTFARLQRLFDAVFPDNWLYPWQAPRDTDERRT